MRFRDFVIGMLLGGFTGAMVMFLLAPKSGKRTRAQLQHQYTDLRDQIAESVEDAEEQALRRAHKMASKARNTMEDMQHRGQTVFIGK